MPMITPSPVAPVVFQKPLSPLKPRKAGVVAVSSSRISSLLTASTPLLMASFAACASLSSAANPLKA